MSAVLRILASALLVAVALTASGCGAPAPPAAEPDIAGVVSGLTTNADEGTYSFLVTGTGSYDKAWVATTSETSILALDGGEYVETTALFDGITVEVWFTGPVAESYPVQATAQTVVIVDESGRPD